METYIQYQTCRLNFKFIYVVFFQFQSMRYATKQKATKKIRKTQRVRHRQREEET